MKFRDNILLYILVPLILLSMGASYVRFMVTHDYIVAYEGTCDPSMHSCFVGCTDEECTEEYYYSNVQKSAVDLNAECGDDITDCEKANLCQPSDQKCSVTYCDPSTEDKCKVSETEPEKTVKIPENGAPQENVPIKTDL